MAELNYIAAEGERDGTSLLKGIQLTAEYLGE